MRFSDLALAIAAAAPASANPLQWAKRQFGGGFGGGAAGGTITLDASKTYQKMDGFGFSLAFQRANLITNNPSEKYKQELLDLLFSRETGAGLSIIRNGIGSSTSSNSDWMNTFAPDNPGGPDAEPVWKWDGKDSGQLWVSQQAVEKYGVTQIYGNAWSPPAYMKTNNNENNGGNLSPAWYQAFANYLVQYVRFYAEAGVNITHLGPMNEPDFSASYASALWNGNQAADFIKVLHPTLESAGLGSQVAITCCESAGWGHQSAMLGDIKRSGAEALLGAVTTHTYMGGAQGSFDTKVPVWFSEQCDLNGQWSTGWNSGGAGAGIVWARNIMDAVLNHNAGGYLYWEGVQWPNPNTNEKMIRVDETTGAYEVASRLWAFANWSRFVRPGAVRIGTSGGSGVRIAAFKNVDDSVAVVLLSQGGGGDVTVSAGDVAPAGGAVTAWASDETKKCEAIEVTGEGGEVVVNVAANSITTVHFGAAVAAEEPVEETPVEEPAEETPIEETPIEEEPAEP
ncbi:uncharacterized protein DNG_01406 [Cephalotrichum gorgonifer]|uniref:Uncharacterized protein n=1 Tax=Cephalotrichum gorgonifer TaxID=2041049 RepID=A0AAE8MR24_9PEZI|nr:uncharacterized protein DNG_01406 [Cephalotrichum gorgonifer]